jgi:hypothetical protein
MTFKPAPFADGRRGLAALLLLLLADAVLMWIMLALPTGGLAFVVLLLALALWVPILYVGWRTWLCLSVAYWIDRNAVTIAWGPLRQIIPLGEIREVRRGLAGMAVLPGWLRRLDPLTQADGWERVERYAIYGPEIEATRKIEGMDVTSVATLPLAGQLLLVTGQEAFGISPEDPEGFLEALEQHHELGPTRLLAVERQRPEVVELPLWHDRLALAVLLAGLAGSLILLGAYMVRFAGMPPVVEGVSRDALILLPVFGFAVWVINGVWGMLLYGEQRVGALLLWIGTLVVQAVCLVALFSVTG